ncbi:MAG: hypothetical protein KAS72_12050 [Phycisphaerales bacterium]|nr:hypothetical protein [Phycisphaerales bacterium]
MTIVLRHRRIAFAGYAVVLTVATHWPNLEISVGPIPRPDIVLHVACFGLLTVVMAFAELFRRQALALSHVMLCWLAATAWSGVDELSQGLPGINRWVMWSDFGANVLGVTLAAVVLAIVGMVRRRRASRSPLGRG